MRPHLILGLLAIVFAILAVPAGGSKPVPTTPALLVAHVDLPPSVVGELPSWPAPDPFDGALLDDLETGPLDLPFDATQADQPLSAPQEPVADPVPVEWKLVGPPSRMAADAIANAKALLGVPYLWGGNSTAGMDCSAYVSRAWGVPRQTTDTLYLVAYPIGKEDLLPGDAMNLTKSQDPRGYGHVRMFAAWANADHSRVWVYEETPRVSIYHVIAYDSRYTPMRRVNIVEDGSPAPLVLEPVATPYAGSAPRTQPSTTRTPGTPSVPFPQDVTPTSRTVPTRPASTPTPIPRPSPTVVPTIPAPTRSAPVATATPTAPRATPTPTTTILRPTATPPILRPTATPTPWRRSR